MAAGALAMWGVYFDTAWHRTVGRDTFWSPPHLFIYGAGFLAWVSSMTAIVLATRGRLVDLGGVVLRAGPVRLPLGFAMSAFGTAVIVLAVPVDLLWHAAFGKDVSVWSPPHLQGVIGGAIGALGVLFAVAGQNGRGPFRSRALWAFTMLLPFVDLLQYVHWSLAHYTLFPWTRTPDFFPWLVALTVPLIVVASARAVGPWAPVGVGLLLTFVLVVISLGIAAIGFKRPAITPVFAVPAVAVALLYRAPGRRDGPGLAAIAGALYALAFVAWESAWMAWVIGAPWPAATVLKSLPLTIATGAVIGGVGWVLGGFLRAAWIDGGAAEVFGGLRRARLAARLAVVAMAAGLFSTYQPQVFGPPLTPGEMALAPSTTFEVKEALFLDALKSDEWPHARVMDLYTEGIMDGVPLPIGPGWCGPHGPPPVGALTDFTLALSVNGAAVDLAPYPTVRRQLVDGRHCDFVGVVSRRQRASRNTFVYTLTPKPGAPRSLRPITVRHTVVFKDP
jgi:hypothetical protein